MNHYPRTAKEALFTEMLGDLDRMLSRIENLPALVDGCETRLSATSARLEATGEKYGKVVTAFTEQAKGELSDFLDRKAATFLEEQATALRQIARDALLSEMEGFKSNLYNGNRQSCLFRLLEHSVIALLASLLTVFLMYLAF